MKRCKACGREFSKDSKGITFDDISDYFDDDDGVLFKYNGDDNILRFENKTGAFLYEIELNRIEDFNDLSSWILHLSEKIWMGAFDLRNFAEKVSEIKGWSINNL